MIGKVIKQFSEAENIPLKSTPGVNVGLIIENKATPLMRFFKKTSNGYGPYNFNPSLIDPNLDDYFHTRLNHDEMYYRFDLIGPEIEYFLDKKIIDYPESINFMEKKIEDIHKNRCKEFIWFLC